MFDSRSINDVPLDSARRLGFQAVVDLLHTLTVNDLLQSAECTNQEVLSSSKASWRLRLKLDRKR